MSAVLSLPPETASATPAAGLPMRLPNRHSSSAHGIKTSTEVMGLAPANAPLPPRPFRLQGRQRQGEPDAPTETPKDSSKDGAKARATRSAPKALRWSSSL